MLEDYFDFLTPDDVRLRGSRIGIETVLYEHIYRARTPEDIQQTFPSLTLDQVYATILYRLRNQQSVDRYLSRWLEFSRTARAEQDRNPPPVVARLRALKAEAEDSGLSPERYLREQSVRRAPDEEELVAA